MSRLLPILLLLVASNSLLAAERNPNCTYNLTYEPQTRSLVGEKPSCDWDPKGGPMELQIYLANLPEGPSSLPVNVNCTVQGDLKGPLGGWIPPIQGKKNFCCKFAKSFPITWNYSNEGRDHGNILVYVDESVPSAAIQCDVTLADTGKGE